VDEATRRSASWRLDPAVLGAVGAVGVVVDPELRIRHLNEAALDFLGRSEEALVGADLVETLFDDSAAGGVAEVLAQVVGDARSWRGELLMRRPHGSGQAAVVACTPVWHGNDVAGAVVLAEPIVADRRDSRAAHRFADRLTRLARVSAELMLADDLDAVTKVTIEHTADAAGATVSSLSLLVDEETLALVGIRGASEGVASRWATYPVSARTPTSECVRTGRRVLLSGRDEIHRRFPDLERAAEGERSMVSLPLRAGGRVLGAFAMSFPGKRDFEANELEFFNILADACAQAVDRVNAVAEATDQRLKLRFLADASAELAGSLDYKTTLSRVAELAVPGFADWCSVQLLDDGELRTIAVAHVDPEKVALALDLQRRYPADRDAPQGAYHVLRTRSSELIPEIPDELLVAATRDAEHLRLARELNLRSAITVPLIARDRAFGVITWVAGEEGRRFGPQDLEFAEDLGRRAAVAIDNSELHSEISAVAARLQRAVLPDGVPQLPGWEIAALYRPAGRTEVGGDFYDIVPLPDGRVAIVVGDVMGRGVQAAAAMAQMRAAVRAYLAVEPSPGDVMAKLDLLLERFRLAQLVTVVYGVLDPVAREVVLANAGHPAPRVLRADGSVSAFPDAEGPPLGVGGPRGAPVSLPFGSGDLLVAFSDGLVERRTEDIDEGFARLDAALPRLTGAGLAPDLQSGLELLVEDVRDHTRDDDVVAVALRTSDRR
jgi:GAF domain-containing protein